MMAPAMTQAPARSGMEKSARLLLSLGPRAKAIWDRLAPHEVDRLSQAMEAASGTPQHSDNALIADFQREARSVPANVSATKPQTVWQRLSQLRAADLAALLLEEPVAVMAVVAMQLDTRTVAGLMEALPNDKGLELLYRLMHTGEVPAGTVRLIGEAFEERLDGGVRQEPAGRVAGILDRMPGPEAKRLLAGLATRAPHDATRVRALMFTFDDLAQLNAAGIQTLLSRTDRAVLALAMKGADERTRELISANMTQRARTQLDEEMAALGAVRRTQIEDARAIIMEEVRTLIDRGELSVGGRRNDDDLVE